MFIDGFLHFITDVQTETGFAVIGLGELAGGAERWV
jgi:hypothetical protein